MGFSALSARVLNLLTKEGINSEEDILGLTEMKLLLIPGLGWKGVREVSEALESAGIVARYTRVSESETPFEKLERLKGALAEQLGDG